MKLFNFFFFNDTATTEIYTLSLHDALPIFHLFSHASISLRSLKEPILKERNEMRSEEHTSELQSLRHLVCRLLLEKKKKTQRGSLYQRYHHPTALLPAP